MSDSSNFDNPKFKYLDFYSNCILSFIVLQGLAFCYTFGTQKFFNDKIKEHKFLAIFLIILFSIILISAIATLFNYKIILTKMFDRKEDKKIISLNFFGKIILSLMFGSLPIIILIVYGL